MQCFCCLYYNVSMTSSSWLLFRIVILYQQKKIHKVFFITFQFYRLKPKFITNWNASHRANIKVDNDIKIVTLKYS